MILDSIVGAAGETLGNVCPMVACTIPLKFENDKIFLLGPRGFRNVGIEVIVPSLSTLFANSS